MHKEILSAKIKTKHPSASDVTNNQVSNTNSIHNHLSCCHGKKTVTPENNVLFDPDFSNLVMHITGETELTSI